MRQPDIIQFLRLLRVGEIEVSSDGEWVRSSCPLAFWTHISGTDNNPSFGIKINDSGLSGYHCFSCHSGSLADLIHILTFTRGLSSEVHRFYSEHEIFEDYEDSKPGAVYQDAYSLGLSAETFEDRVPVPDYVLDQFPPIIGTHGPEATANREWLHSRGIFDDAIVDFDLRYSRALRAVVFPIKDRDGLTYWLHARSRERKGFFYLTPENVGSPDIRWGRRDSWFGIDKLDPSQPVILVESETDLLRLYSLGINNVIASHGSVGKRSNKVRRLIQLGVRSVVLGFDSDETGARYCQRCIHLLHSECTLVRVSWAVAGLKDAGDLQSVDQLRDIWAHRRYIENGRVISRNPPTYADRYGQSST